MKIFKITEPQFFVLARGDFSQFRADYSDFCRENPDCQGISFDGLDFSKTFQSYIDYICETPSDRTKYFGDSDPNQLFAESERKKRIYENAFAALEGLQMSYLGLSDCGISDELLVIVLERANKLKIRHLDLSSNPHLKPEKQTQHSRDGMSLTGYKYLLQNLGSIDQLTIGYNKLGSEDLEELKPFIKESSDPKNASHLKFLDLTHNWIMDLKVVEDILDECPHLTVVIGENCFASKDKKAFDARMSSTHQVDPQTGTVAPLLQKPCGAPTYEADLMTDGVATFAPNYDQKRSISESLARLSATGEQPDFTPRDDKGKRSVSSSPSSSNPH
ncbi:MAG: hypothetical protein ACHQUC_07300 [Chlamydiales bacterium]